MTNSKTDESVEAVSARARAKHFTQTLEKSAYFELSIKGKCRGKFCNC